MIHPHTTLRFVSHEVGHGVFATQFIPAGTITWCFDILDRTYSQEAIAQMPVALRDYFYTYTYRNAKGEFVLLWDHTKYMNHSFNPNCMATPYQVEIAVRDILPGEQLTNDYGMFNILEPFEPVGEHFGRGVILPDDLKRCAHDWDKILIDTYPKIIDVYQPLKEIMPIDIWHRLIQIVTGAEKPNSVIDNLFEP